MGGVRPVPCEDFLVDGGGVLVPVFWRMELNLVSLEGSAVSSSVFCGTCPLMCRVVLLFCGGLAWGVLHW